MGGVKAQVPGGLTRGMRAVGASEALRAGRERVGTGRPLRTQSPGARPARGGSQRMRITPVPGPARGEVTRRSRSRSGDLRAEEGGTAGHRPLREHRALRSCGKQRSPGK
jgi:hypothetical protein